MVGKTSLWPVWRAQLPVGKQIESAALSRLKLWASFLDPDFKHSNHVTHLALQLYDGLPNRPAAGLSEATDDRSILEVASLMHDVGRSKKEKSHHKATYKLIDRMTPPLGWSKENMHLAAVVARYHRGALPWAGQKTLEGLSPDQKQIVFRLAGILRLANAFDSQADSHVQRLQVRQQNGFIEVAAQGYSPRDRTAESIAAARHLLETVYDQPIMIKPLRVTKPNRPSSPKPAA
jgi:exopolyphosphatase/guanosine-5'-triphosphate,3'-diphosphate pyrophosphatase